MVAREQKQTLSTLTKPDRQSLTLPQTVRVKNRRPVGPKATGLAFFAPMQLNSLTHDEHFTTIGASGAQSAGQYKHDSPTAAATHVKAQSPSKPINAYAVSRESLASDCGPRYASD